MFVSSGSVKFEVELTNRYILFCRSKKLFQTLIYSHPAFQRVNEAHLRLGLIFEIEEEFESSLKHFKLALLDHSPCSLSSFEIRFRIARLHETSGKPKLAKEFYEEIVKEKDLPVHLKADINRQIGELGYLVLLLLKSCIFLSSVFGNS